MRRLMTDEPAPATKKRRPAKGAAKADSAEPAKKAKKRAKPAEGVAETPDAESDGGRAVKRNGPSLVIVESPAKAKTIGRFLGKDFEVRASMGHVRDLPVRGLGVEIDKKGVHLRYEVIPEKTKVIGELAKLARRAPTVYFATDLDREGEAIAWHLSHALAVPAEISQRVTFHEITKRAIEESFSHPGQIDVGRVDAQQARRVLDRIVGYPLSRLLSKAISRGLSAGRVQSVAVKLITDREKEIRAFKAVDYWRVFADLAKPGLPDGFTADLVHLDQTDDDSSWASDAATPEGTDDDLEKEETGEVAAADASADGATAAPAAKAPPKSRELRLHRAEDAEALVAELRGARFTVESVDARRRQDWAPPPFITSTLQQQGSIRLRWPTKQTMKVAQELYEGLPVGEEGPVGLITYMRTDSVSLAGEAVDACRSYVAAIYGAEFVPAKPNFFRSKKGAQEAHEAIRPTDVRRTPERIRRYLSDDQFRLYKMVWERFVACQMAPAEIDTTAVRIRAGRAVFEARGKVTAFEGWRAVAPAPKKDDEPALPPLAERDALDLRGLRHEMRTTQPPPRYSEATLVKRLEKEGIGRPSTYAETISKILARKYVAKLQGKFHATELGEVVTDRMTPYFPDLMDIAFTRRMEEELDEVERGKMDWQKLIRTFHADFEKELEVADVGMVKEKFKPAEGVAPCETCGKPMVVRFSAGRKFYGCSGYPECKATRGGEGDARKAAIPTEHVCEKCGKGMVIREGRRGRFLACSGYPECRNAKDVDDAGKIVEQQKTGEMCEKCGAEMVVKKGRRGPFLACPRYPECQNARDIGSSPAPGVGDALTSPDGAAPAARPARPALTALVPLPPCTKCGAPTSLRRSFRGVFCGCTKYPECKGTAPVPPGALPPREPPKPAGADCPNCGKPMVIRTGKRGPFAGCSGYPKCKTAMPLEDITPKA
ncbi:MAG: DNA topoisomerase 1 [Planctomycetes bacterium]|nr:DNA topoisomerase 1 [Planctomycetota bacterium]